jgi:rSAM/selenodomain-associated transferase 1
MIKSPKQVLIVFLKYPEPGRVKTRLARDIGRRNASLIYSEIAQSVIGKVSKSNEYKTIIFFDPPEKEEDVRRWLKNTNLTLLPQEGNLLGERMLNAFERAFSLGATSTVIIGTDCMEVSDKTVLEAFRALREVDAVLGPARDGGYYLLGLNRPFPWVFKGIEWSKNLVLSQTIKKLEEKKQRFKLLETLTDVDTIRDLSKELLLKVKEDKKWTL